MSNFQSIFTIKSSTDDNKAKVNDPVNEDEVDDNSNRTYSKDSPSTKDITYISAYKSRYGRPKSILEINRADRERSATPLASHGDDMSHSRR